MLSVTYIFHDCFLVETHDCALLFDFWQDTTASPDSLPAFLKSLPHDKPLYIFVSHHHKDHFNRTIFSWAKDYCNARFIISYDTWKISRHFITATSGYKGYKPPQEAVFVLRPGEELSLPHIKVNAFGSTDTGCSWLVTTSSQHTIFHAGDLNAWIWKDESSDAEVERALDDFRSCLKPIEQVSRHINIAMFPVDSRIGSEYWTGAEIFVRTFKIDKFFPMHFELGATKEEICCRHREATDFIKYANPTHGEYIALMEPYSCAMFANGD